MVKINYKVCAVTVTYGNRWEFLKQIIDRLLSFDNISQVVVVNNASSYNVKAETGHFADNRIIVLDNSENLGSTGGYNAGIQYAHTTNADFIWLLDDDNLPSDNALDALLKAWDEISAPVDKAALFSLRTDRIHHIHIAKGENPYRYYLIPDNFLNFTFLRPYVKLLKFADKFKKYRQYKKWVKIPFASYGGFFLPRQMLDSIGYPDGKFYLYFDDAEYTYRVTQNGGAIWLVPGSIITDVDHSYQVAYKRRFLHSIHLDLWNFRTYYIIRNGIYFYKLNASKRPFIFKINRFLFMSWLKLLSIAGSKQQEFKKLQAAVQDGLAGNLGQASADKF